MSIEEVKLTSSGPSRASTETLSHALYEYFACGLDCHHCKHCSDGWWDCCIPGGLWDAGYDARNLRQRHEYANCGQLIGAVKDELRKRGFIPKCQWASLSLDGKQEILADIIVSKDGSDFCLARPNSEYARERLSLIKIYDLNRY